MFKLGDSPLRHLTLRAAMLRALVGSWMTLIVLFPPTLGSFPSFVREIGGIAACKARRFDFFNTLDFHRNAAHVTAPPDTQSVRSR